MDREKPFASASLLYSLLSLTTTAVRVKLIGLLSLFNRLTAHFTTTTTITALLPHYFILVACSGAVAPTVLLGYTQEVSWGGLSLVGLRLRWVLWFPFGSQDFGVVSVLPPWALTPTSCERGPTVGSLTGYQPYLSRAVSVPLLCH